MYNQLVNENVTLMMLLKMVRSINPNISVLEAKTLAKYWRLYADSYYNPYLYFEGFARFVGKFTSGQWAIENEKIVRPMVEVTYADIRDAAAF